MFALQEQHKEIIKLLIEKGANVNMKNNNGKTALDLVKTQEIKNLLTKAGAKI